MEKLDTYNRVPDLESRTPVRICVVGAVVLWVAAIGCLLSPWWIGLGVTPALTAAAIAALAGLLVWRLQPTVEKRCRFCRSSLDKVTRPLLLTPKLLSLEGKKLGNHFYTRKKLKPWLAQDWIKLSNQTQVCHHCRLTEESYRQVQERPSSQELHWLDSPTAAERSKIDQSQ